MVLMGKINQHSHTDNNDYTEHCSVHCSVCTVGSATFKSTSGAVAKRNIKHIDGASTKIYIWTQETI